MPEEESCSGVFFFLERTTVKPTVFPGLNTHTTVNGTRVNFDLSAQAFDINNDKKFTTTLDGVATKNNGSSNYFGTNIFRYNCHSY